VLVWDAGERSQQPIFFIYLFCLLYIFVINTFSGFSVPVSVFNKWAGNSGGPCTIGPWVARIAHYHTSPQPVVLESGPTWHGHTPPPSNDPIQSNYLPSLHCTAPTRLPLRPCRGVGDGEGNGNEPAAPATPKPRPTSMAIHLRAHAFAANPLRGVSAATTSRSPSAAAEALRYLLDPSSAAAAANPSQYLSKILPFRRGRPLARSTDPPAVPAWRLAWLPPSRVPGVALDAFVFLGALVEGDGKEASAYWAVDVSEGEGARVGGPADGDGPSAFVDLRTLMVATDWSDKDAMAELAIAGHVCKILCLISGVLFSADDSKNMFHLVSEFGAGSSTARMAQHGKILWSLWSKGCTY
jgi:hypothetical protein